jgi:protein-tyrosine phosphatase
MPDCRIRYDENIRHFFFALKDIKSENIAQYFNKCAKFIKEGLKLGSVLVHCAAGVSRVTFLLNLVNDFCNSLFD